MIRKAAISGVIQFHLLLLYVYNVCLFLSFRHPKVILALSFFYFTFSCGLEAFFQSQSFTFALCGPHLFIPSQAATLTTIYFSR